ncbi:MAG: hypothetical protein Q7R40_12825 [Phaeospirillum sp.]|nr:hypothetical protein [Phaeospirillum sp.]
MHPLLTFASGLVAGIVGIRLLKKAPPLELEGIGGKARQGLTQAQASLRDATVSGLTAIETSSANLRAKLTPAAADPVTTAKPVRVRKPAARKAKAAPTADGGTAP